METSSRIQSVARALSILDTSAEALRELAFHEIADRLGLPKSTIHGLISTLKDFGYIEQSTFTAKYKLGLRLFEVGSVVDHRLVCTHSGSAVKVHDTPGRY